MRAIGPLCLCGVIGAVAAAQQPPPASAPPLVLVRPIDPPATPLPSEAASAGVTRFSFIAYGDTRSGGAVGRSRRRADRPGGAQPRGRPDDRAHSRERVDAISRSVSSCSRAMRCCEVRTARCGTSASRRSSSGSRAGRTFRTFFSVGNHDVTTMPPGDPGRALGLQQHADGDVETDSVGGIAASPERLSDVHVRLWERVLHRARLEHRQRLVPAGLGVGPARTPRSRAVPARDRVLSSPGVLGGAAWRRVGRRRAGHRPESAGSPRAADRSRSGPLHAAVPEAPRDG